MKNIPSQRERQRVLSERKIMEKNLGSAFSILAAHYYPFRFLSWWWLEEEEETKIYTLIRGSSENGEK